ncbi:hypothetical protein BBO99_00009848 [Phytophthora kernoviae]|uniref:Uncharacterized protein n=1 Tax=Phytophthora kernoviae TaxID=325452 RepID=A0A3R7MQ61_9STRA|nr:hypothetical protein JM18_009880 [Phytophthora kernoviae]RLN21165.1 hypothetical protein BBI17_009952 [Phytophthora kernoviae]RLN72310.1 hypothetical protein BBO99_00009848 [Phytophthora kernoviae]
MGRVSAKRKLKQCDPFFKGKRENGKKQQAYDLPPTESKRSKKRRRKAVSDEAMEQFVLRTSAVDGEGSTSQVKRVIYDAAKKSKRSSEKRKDYLAKKKSKTRDKKMTEQERYERDYQATGNTQKDYFEDTEKVRFGERVDAPPIMPKLSGIFKKRADALAREKAKAEKKAAVGGSRPNKRARK